LSSAPEPVGTLDVALAHAARLLEREPTLAAEQSTEILKALPGYPQARLIPAQARRLQGNLNAALELLGPLAREQPRAAAVQLEFGLAQAEAGRLNEASEAFKSATRLKPDHPDGWRALADTLDALGDSAGFIDPFAGDGISLALQGGALAAQCLTGFLQARFSWNESHRQYRAAYLKRLAPAFRNAARLRMLLAAPSWLRAGLVHLAGTRPISNLIVRRTRAKGFLSLT